MTDFEMRKDKQIEQAIAKYMTMLFRVAYSITRSRQDSEDVVQEVFLRWTRHRADFRSDEHEKAWLIKATVNRARSNQTSAWKRRIVPVEDVFEGVQDEAEHPATDAVAKLPEKQRIVVHLHYFEDMSVVEIARLTGMPESTVKSHLKRAREALKDLLKGEYDGF